MAFIIETPNAFEPTNVRKHLHPGGISIRQWLETQYPGFIEFELPTICLVNGQAQMRKDWDKEIRPNDVVNFVAVQGWVVVIIVILVVALSIALALTMQTPAVPGETPGSEPVFSVKGQQNDIRLGEPIEVCYGRNRIFPSFASRPFYQYQNNDQFQFSLLCLGQGEFEIDTVYIGDTDINDFQEVEFEVVGPGEALTLFPSNVYTSAEAGGQTLFASNEAEYSGDGWVGPFPANPSGSETEKIEIDIVFPKGIYRMSSSGGLRQLAVTLEARKRLIDDAGTPLGDWTALIPDSAPTSISGSLYFTGKTTTPIRKTFSAAVTAGRYEVRLRRTDEKRISHKVGHDAVWEGLRAYIDTPPDFGDVTLLAVKIRATNNLNDRTSRRFSVVATRKLSTRHINGTWNAPVASRSIVWAMVDVFRSNYGGRIDDDTFFDFDTIYAMDEFYEGRNEHFDWVFRDPITVWDAAKTIARAGRAIPLISGSLITLKRDGPLTVPVTLFTPDNIVKDTFQWDIKLWDLDEHDSVAIEYTEVSTGYKQEEVLCTLPGGTTDNPKNVRLAGVQDRNHAYHEGLYLIASDRYLRENITFETGMEGYIPTYGDLIAIAHDVPSWGQSGYIVHAVEDSGNLFFLYLSEPVSFESGQTHQILLRGSKGQVIGPLTAEETDNPSQIAVTIAQEVDFLLGGTTEPMLFHFGPVSTETKYARVVKVEPQGQERVKITAVNEAAVIHSYDDLEAPALATPALPPEIPDLPVISSLTLTQTNDLLQVVQASWPAAFGALRYLVQISEDGENWEFVMETTRTSVQLQVRTGVFWVRVAAINTGQGPWITETITVGFLTGLDITVPWVDLEWAVAWRDVLNAQGYRLWLYDMTESNPVLKHTEDKTVLDLAFAYDYPAALADGNLSRDMQLVVDVLFQDDDGPGIVASELPVTLDLSNAIPAAPSGLGSEFVEIDSNQDYVYRLYWTLPSDLDLIRVQVWLSNVNGFDPAVEIPILDEAMAAPMDSAGLPLETLIQISLDSYELHETYYWRVAVFDVWGEELSTNVSAQQTIEALIPPWLLTYGTWDDLGGWDDTETWID